MKRERLHKLMALLAVLALLGVQNVGVVFAELPVVHAVLFYSPTCGHCHYVITEVLPPLFEQYGEQLQMMGVSTANAQGQTLYQAAVERFNIPAERRGVPALVLDEIVLVGSNEIPEQLPVLIEQYLAEGGIGWPDIPGLAEALQTIEAAADATPESTADATAESTPDQATAIAAAAAPDPPTQPDIGVIAPQSGLFSSNDSASDDLISKLQRDPAGNSLAILLLAGMLAVIGRVLRRLWLDGAKITSLANDLKGWRSWAVAALCLIGLGVSVYLAYVETTHTTAVCGPIGDCNTVQQSPYAVLFGLIPVGVLGVVGYAAMLIAWAGIQRGQGQFRSLSESALLGMALAGTLFSIYLTFLEPFVIGATCAWCLTSALSMTLILLVLAGSTPVHAEPTRQEALA